MTRAAVYKTLLFSNQTDPEANNSFVNNGLFEFRFYYHVISFFIT